MLVLPQLVSVGKKKAFFSVETLFTAFAFIAFSSLLFSFLSSVENGTWVFGHESSSRWLSSAVQLYAETYRRHPGSDFVRVGKRLDEDMAFFSTTVSTSSSPTVKYLLWVDGLDTSDQFTLVFNDGFSTQECVVTPPYEDYGNVGSSAFETSSCFGDSFDAVEGFCDVSGLNLSRATIGFRVSSGCVYVFGVEVEPA